MSDSRITPVFMIQRTLSAPINRMFDAWADPVQMALWSGPQGTQVHVLTGTIATGERLHARSEAMDGSVMFTVCHYRLVDPPHHLVYDQCFADEAGNLAPCPFFDVWPQTLQTDIRFEELDEGTRITLCWTPVNATEEEEAVFAGAMESMTGGWGGSLEKLAEYLAT